VFVNYKMKVAYAGAWFSPDCCWLVPIKAEAEPQFRVVCREDPTRPGEPMLPAEMIFSNIREWVSSGRIAIPPPSMESFVGQMPDQLLFRELSPQTMDHCLGKTDSESGIEFAPNVHWYDFPMSGFYGCDRINGKMPNVRGRYIGRIGEVGYVVDVAEVQDAPAAPSVAWSNEAARDLANWAHNLVLMHVLGPDVEPSVQQSYEAIKRWENDFAVVRVAADRWIEYRLRMVHRRTVTSEGYLALCFTDPQDIGECVTSGKEQQLGGGAILRDEDWTEDDLRTAARRRGTELTRELNLASSGRTQGFFSDQFVWTYRYDLERLHNGEAYSAQVYYDLSRCWADSRFLPPRGRFRCGRLIWETREGVDANACMWDVYREY
jgi:hypothetical protein